MKNKKSNKLKNKSYNRTHKNKRKIGGSSIYYDGEITKSSLTYNGKPFFRKIFYYSNPPTKIQKSIVLTENKIVKILMKNPHPNIAHYFNVNKHFVDMEELDTNHINVDKVKETMREVKDFLQSLGIIYLDWKTDNIGRDNNGDYKLFDFDSSGIINTYNNTWIVEPAPFWNYKNALENGLVQPIEIDNWCFENGFE
jgi:serine/threonine protein kinase